MKCTNDAYKTSRVKEVEIDFEFHMAFLIGSDA